MAIIEKEEYDRVFGSANLTVTDEEYEKLSAYSKLLCEWNEKVNLTAITEPTEIVVKHFFDSIYPFTLFDVKEGASIADIGTGAGFPSCPLKIVRDDIKLTLLDSLQKRIVFLAQLSETLDLGATCVHGRAEELGRSGEYREQFDIATARAVANLSNLCEYCLPFVKKDGYFAALKGADVETELKDAKGAIKILGGKTEEVFSYNLPTGDKRTLILIRKISETPEKYPRNKGQMVKKPLK